MKKLVLLAIVLTMHIAFSQTDTLTVGVENKKPLTVKDTLFLKDSNNNNTIISPNKANEIDSLWRKELLKSPLNDTIQYVLKKEELVYSSLQELPTALLKQRLKELNSKTPFYIEYNPQLERVIKSYLKRRKSTFSNLLEKARYYFPIFEEQLAKYNLPLEIKYLAIVESALRPRAKSRVGATGLWQFMFQTGKQFGLKVSSYVDERSDPYRATEAACKYLSSLYDIFGDWDLALASYNSGPGNVSKAIRRSNGNTNYWNIRHNLPYETADYLPAFYATLYIFEYAKEHNIKAKSNVLAKFETDTIQIKRQLTFEQIHETIGIDVETLQFLNPQYKLDIIPYIKGRNYTLEVPTKYIGKFLTNESEIYDFAEEQDAKREKPLPKYIENMNRVRYRVRKGDYLGKIARKFGVSVSRIKRWNNMRSTRLRIGQRLTIYPRK